MGKSRDIADGTRYVDASGDTFLGDLTGGTPSTAGAAVRFSNNTNSNEKWSMYGWDDQFQISKRDANWGWAGTYLAVDTSGSVLTPNQPSFSAYDSGPQVIPTATWTQVTLNSVRWDVNTNYNTSSYRFTAPVDGNYLFGYTVQFNQSSTEYLYSGLKVNGSFYHYGQGRRLITSGGSYWGNDNTLNSCQLIRLSMGDYVELWAYNSSGGEILGGLSRRSFFGYLVG